jgi:hypothetical protein
MRTISYKEFVHTYKPVANPHTEGEPVLWSMTESMNVTVNGDKYTWYVFLAPLTFLITTNTPEQQEGHRCFAKVFTKVPWTTPTETFFDPDEEPTCYPAS